jgi:dTDP-4-amino-4,6-dideoxygalactose transaminase
MKSTITDSPQGERDEAVRQPAFPFLDLRAQFSSIRDEVMAAVAQIMESQHFILGPEVQACEKEVADYVSSKYAVSCASGSDALLLSLMALDVGVGDEVITTPFTFVATVSAIVRLGATPVFVDIDCDTYNIDAGQIEWAISPKTKAIIPVHLFGMSAEMQSIMNIAAARCIPVVEDAAQAIGARYAEVSVGTMGAFGCFSFFPSKNLGGAGDGGLVTTQDPLLADRLKVLRTHGSRNKYIYEILGVNSRLDALQAAILRVKLRYLDRWNKGRQLNAARYSALFAELGLNEKVRVPIVPPDRSHVYNQFVVRVEQRDQLKRHLQQSGIPTEIYYPSPLHMQPAFAHLGYKKGDLPESEAASRQVLALPIFPELAEAQQRQVVGAIADFYEV